MKKKEKKSRKDVQLPRRIFHMMNGSIIAMLYLFYLEKSDLVTFLGIIASVIFIAEQVRLKYPELSDFFSKMNNLLYRAEEQFEIASAMPYAASCLLVVFAFPKAIAIITVLFLALGDPLAAIVGIKYGKHKITSNRSMEGSIAFFWISFAICFFIMKYFHDNIWQILLFAFFGGIIGLVADFIETRLDDNITIPFISAPLLLLLSWLIWGKVF
jgi:diacylglycerol kinase (CTP)